MTLYVLRFSLECDQCGDAARASVCFIVFATCCLRYILKISRQNDDRPTFIVTFSRCCLLFKFPAPLKFMALYKSVYYYYYYYYYYYLIAKKLCLNVNVMLSNTPFLMIFAIFGPLPLTRWINCRHYYEYLLFCCQNCVMCHCVITKYI